MLPETRYSLIARLARGDDRKTWEQFVQTYEGAILRYCRSKGLQEADAAEVAQEVFLVVHKRAEHWKPSGRDGSFRAWLLETARRNCLASIRKRARQTPGEAFPDQVARCAVADPAQNDPAQDDDEDWQRWAFYAASQQVQNDVNPQTWQAFWLAAVENVDPHQVAERLGISVGNVYTCKCRVMSRIRIRIDELSSNEHRCTE